MMRFQRISPDCLPLSNGKKHGLRTSVIKEDNNGSENGRTSVSSYTPNFEPKGFRFRSPSKTPEHHHSNGGASPLTENHHHHRESSPSPSRTGGDILLQWGQKKRARASRVVNDDSSAQVMKAQRRTIQATPRSPAPASATAPPPPPPPPPPSASNGRVGNLRRESHGLLPKRNLEERSGVANRSPSRTSGGGSRVVSRSAAGKRSPPTPEKADRKMPPSGTAKDDKPNGSIAPPHEHRKRSDSAPPEQEGRTNHNISAAAEKATTVEVVEWPRIYISLSRKEKEDDFLAMKGTKLPHRPKKRAKNIDKALQYCFPGMWLSDLTKSRYEVREKKCVKKQKRRGLKGMESMDSDSE